MGTWTPLVSARGPLDPLVSAQGPPWIPPWSQPWGPWIPLVSAHVFAPCRNKVLQMSSGLTEEGSVPGHLAVSLLVCWAWVFTLCFPGMYYMGRSVTVLGAYTALSLCSVRTLTPSPCSVRTLRRHRVQCVHCAVTVFSACTALTPCLVRGFTAHIPSFWTQQESQHRCL